VTRRRTDAGFSPGTVRFLLVAGGVLFLARLIVKSAAHLAGGVSPGMLPVTLCSWAVLWILAIGIFIPGFLLAERGSRRWGHRLAIYSAVVLLGSAAAALITVPLCDALGIEARFWVAPGSAVPRSFTAFLDVLMRITLAAFLYSSHRQGLASAQALQQLESARNELVGRLAESRLQTARSRVRPEAFIGELQALRRKYAEDEAGAEAMLDAMIVRLRTASRGAAA
jgi:hypothetical protein